MEVMSEEEVLYAWPEDIETLILPMEGKTRRQAFPGKGQREKAPKPSPLLALNGVMQTGQKCPCTDGPCCFLPFSSPGCFLAD